MEYKMAKRKGKLVKVEMHGLTSHPLYKVRNAMIDRCVNEKNPAYKDYGGRGIKVCQAWMDSMTVFYEWAMANGYAHGLSIDRKDNDGDYSPENCKWATLSEQRRNRRKDLEPKYWGKNYKGSKHI